MHLRRFLDLFFVPQKTQQPRVLRQRRPATLPSKIFLRGELLTIETIRLQIGSLLRFGEISIPLALANPNPAEAVLNHLWKLAATELPPRVLDLAALHHVTVRRVTVRNQKSRWGSCSQKGTISLNWRLIQTPPFVRDYIILHELMHLRQMNHSTLFWREVESVCPDYPVAEKWIKQHRGFLRGVAGAE